MMLVNYRNPSYDIFIATFVSGIAECKKLGGDGSSQSNVGLVRQAAEPSPLTGECGWFVMFFLELR